MIGRVLLAIGLICLIFAILAFLGVLLTGKGPILLIIAIICIVAGYFLGERGRTGRVL